MTDLLREMGAKGLSPRITPMNANEEDLTTKSTKGHNPQSTIYHAVPLAFSRDY